MSELVFYPGLGIFIIGGIGLLIAAFRTSILWGLAVLFITPLAIIYLIFHWQDGKGPFKLQIFGFLIMVVFAYMSGGISSVTSAILNLSDINFPRIQTRVFLRLIYRINSSDAMGGHIVLK